MIRSKDLNKEIKDIDESAGAVKPENATEVLLKLLVKVGTLGLKLVRDMKTNQVLGLKKMGVELVKPPKAVVEKKVNDDFKQKVLE